MIIIQTQCEQKKKNMAKEISNGNGEYLIGYLEVNPSLL
jgi:hypothetical protein